MQPVVWKEHAMKDVVVVGTCLVFLFLVFTGLRGCYEVSTSMNAFSDCVAATGDSAQCVKGVKEAR